MQDYHCLHRGREVKTSVLEICEMAQHLGDRRSRMGASGDGCCKKVVKFSISRADTWQAVVVLHTQGDITECFLVVLVPVVCLISGSSGTVDEPLALGPEVGLHGSVPLLPVGTYQNRFLQ